MKNIFIIILLLSFLICNAQNTTEDKEYKAVLKEMFVVSNSDKAYEAVVNQMLIPLRKMRDGVPSEFWDEFEKEMKKSSLDEITDLVIPIYKKYLTVADLKDVILFYKSSCGKKFADSNPLILSESIAVGQAWGAKIGERIAQKIKEKGY
jgi:uncharacterized protein